MMGATQRLTILRSVAGQRDIEGVPDAAFVVMGTVTGSLFEQTSRELINGVWTQVQDWKALLPATVALSSRDVLMDEEGDEYRVMTSVARRGPDGTIHHISATLKRVEQ
jgi:hypothetical protein